ncbi:MAG: type IX secretion system sortase PorU [Flavobacteriaceae bacterium]|nr:type IX secretion system sortase PorU [Flavobacteriaceae bacterium]
MKYFLICLLLFASIMVCAQSYEISWKSKSRVQSVGESTAFVPSIQSEMSYLDPKNIPHINIQEKSIATDYFSIQNIRSKEIQKSDLGDIQFQDLPQGPEYMVRNMKGGNIYQKVADVTGLYRNQNKIFQITGFDIVNTARPPSDFLYSRTPPAAVLHPVNGKFYKISVDTTGIYKIDRSFLTQNGIPTDFNPQKFKIFGNGGMMLPENPGDFRYNGLQENAIYAHGTDDGSFDEGDYFLFYAQGPNGIERKTQNILETEHSKHLYEDKAYYFINFEANSNGKRITSVSIEQEPVQTFNDFDQLYFFEHDLINVYNVGRQWFGHNFAQERNFNINFRGSGNIIGDALLSYRFMGVNAMNTSVSLTVNSSTANANFTGGGSAEFEVRRATANVAATFPLSVQISANMSANPAANIYLDYVRLEFKQALQFQGQQLSFRRFDDLIEGNVYGFNLMGSPEFVWDVSDRTNAVQLVNQSGVYKFNAPSANFPNEFIAFNQNESLRPAFVKLIENQSLASLSNIDYVIVTYPDYINQAKQLAAAHQEVSGVNTAVVTTEQVYNEFGSGAQDISAIRDFFKFLYEFGTLKYALLLGDSSYDFKDRIPNNTNRIPAFQSVLSMGLGSTFVTDDFFGILDDTDRVMPIPHPQELDIAVGRLPANSQREAAVLVGKTLSYIDKNPQKGTPFGDWRSKIMFVVDDDDPGVGNAFHTKVENLSARFIEQNEPAYTLRKLYVDAFIQEGSAGGVRYPAVTDAIVNGIETGTLLVNYFGHGGLNGWAQERIYTQNEIRSATNWNTQFSRLPIFVTVTCDFTVWDIPQLVSGGELLVKNENGGAVAMLTTSREIAVVYGLNINDKIMARLFQVEGNSYLPIGEALRLAKLDYNLGDEGLSVNLIGDPLISMARPPRSISIDRINGEEANTFGGTLRALDFVSIEGKVLNANATGVDSNFNGTLTGTLFDKAVEKTTLNNDGVIDVLTYHEQIDAIYRGSSAVENGNFKLEFFVPKDINFDVGHGKLLLYAQNGVTDAMNFKNDIQIGDINPEGVNDDEGPVVGLYMNNLNFANGGITDRSPYLLACVTDSTGINATGAGIGHDITHLLNGNVNTTTVLNEYFEGGDASPCINPQFRDFQKGRVLYRLNNLELGEHTVTFRIWDINNNSTTETLDFVVMDNGDQQLYINRLLNWPNPFTTQTYFHFEHNCPEILEVQVQVFTVSGKLVKTIRQQVSSAPFREGYRTDKFGIPWDGLDDFGNKIGKGVYLYKTTVKGSNGETCRGTASGTEKLVILK